MSARCRLLIRGILAAVFLSGVVMLSGAASLAFSQEEAAFAPAQPAGPSAAPSERLFAATPFPTATPVAFLSVAGPAATPTIVSTPASVPTPAPEPVALWTVTVDKAALRSGPSRKDACLKLLGEGDVVQLLSDETGGWLYVQTDLGKRGYLDAGQARYSGTQAYTLTPPAPSGWEESPRCAVLDCCDTALRYRAHLDLLDNLIGELSPGEIVRVVAVEGLYFDVVRESTGQTGYMLSSALEPVDPVVDWAVAGGVVGYDTTSYTYEEMLRDIAGLTERYGDWLRVTQTGRSLMGRDIPALRLGGESADLSLFVQASIHAREFATTMLLMEQLEDLLIRLNEPGEEGDGLRALFGRVAVYAVPMANPDGVAISQWGTSSAEGEWLTRLLAWQERDCPRCGTDWYNNYFPAWKANAAGVDLNRNFDARWRYSASAPAPGQLNYKGPEAFSEPESRFLADLLEEYPFSAHLSYHSSGRVLFWYFRQQGELYRRTYQLAGVLRQATGYRRATVEESMSSNAGLKDYAIEKYGIPGVTLEIGSGELPLDPSQYPLIWEQNKDVLEVTARWVLEDAAARAGEDGS